MTDEDFDQVHVQCAALLTCVRAAAVQMRQRGSGRRIIASARPPGNAAAGRQSATAKAGILGMVRTWAMELGSSASPSTVIPVAATAMTETVPFLQPHVEALKAGKPLPAQVRRELGFGAPEDAAGAVSFLASEQAGEITGQAIGIGGDRLSLWSHPDVVVQSYRDGGWSAEAIAAEWQHRFHEHRQSVGEQLPPSEVLMSKYQCAVDFDAITALDDAPVEIDSSGHRSLDDELMAASRSYFKSGAERTVAGRHRAALPRARHGRRRVHRGLRDRHRTCPTRWSRSPKARPGTATSSSRSARWTRGGEPRRCAAMHQLVEQHAGCAASVPPQPAGVRTQRPQVLPAVEAIAEHGVPALPHRPDRDRRQAARRHGIKLRYSDPMLLDDVAADFPELTIIMAHPSVPWQDEAISIATHKSNVYIDLSGWSPKYFPPQLVRAANSMLRHKVLFGSDFPVIQPDRWFADFAKLEIKDDVKPLIYKENALRALRLRD